MAAQAQHLHQDLLPKNSSRAKGGTCRHQLCHILVVVPKLCGQQYSCCDQAEALEALMQSLLFIPLKQVLESDWQYWCAHVRPSMWCNLCQKDMVSGLQV